MKNKLRITNEQMDKLRILESLESFQAEVANFRKKFFIDAAKNLLHKQLANFKSKESVFEYANDLENMGEKFNLPVFMHNYLHEYVQYNMWAFDPIFPKECFEPSTRAPINYQIVAYPIPRMKDGKMIQYSKTVSMVTHARLSDKEEKEALKDLKMRQRVSFDPALTKQVRQKRNIKRDLSIEKEMLTREPKHKEEQLTGYLKSAKREFDKGLTTTQRFTELKRQRPQEIEIIEAGKTSKDVAQNTLGSKKYASSVRQIASRIKRKKKKIFKDNL